MVPILRVGRPTDDVDALLPFYVDGLGFEVLYRFDDHDGFDGIMVGHPRYPYHFEFARRRGHTAGRAPTEDNLLVFYLPDEAVYEVALVRMQMAGFAPVRSFNPFWDEGGATFEDPDGYRVVLTSRAWTR
ncbi:MAG TPA: VOC family protein [Dongiaceae bacterium]|jgi:catechol 2,3-dioxygenase-like lactoylglutathione lyase family enzyme|nr:VOC family protein [Dongiaceae bacterium]